jgi:hypothetical protein
MERVQGEIAMTEFSQEEMKVIKQLLREHEHYEDCLIFPRSITVRKKPRNMTDQEWKEFKEKVGL